MARETKATVIKLVQEDKELMKELVREAVQQVLEVEMTEALGAAKGQRTAGRRGYRSGYYERSLVTRVGKLELRVPQDRDGHFSTELFERYSRAERAFVGSLVEMYVQGVSTRKVKAVTEELCGHEFSASAVSRLNVKLDESLRRFAERPLGEEYPYVMLDARYERVREDGIVQKRAVLIAIGVNYDGRLANRESRTSWKDFLTSLVARGLRGVEFVVSDDHEGLKRAVTQVLPGGVAALLWREELHDAGKGLRGLARRSFGC